jgi:hypothetical protein
MATGGLQLGARCGDAGARAMPSGGLQWGWYGVRCTGRALRGFAPGPAPEHTLPGRDRSAAADPVPGVWERTAPALSAGS